MNCAECRRIQAAANRKRSEAAKVQHEVSKPRAGEKIDYGEHTTSVRTNSRASTNATTTAKAAASKTNRGTVERMDL